jgi:uncharacterized protein (DUF58 family)
MESPESPRYRRCLIGGLTAAVVLGLTLRASALVALGAAGFGLLLHGWWDARRRLASLDVRRSLFPSAFEGDVVGVDLVLENRGRPPAFLVEIADNFAASLSDRPTMLEPGPLGGRRRRRLAYRSGCSRSWGVHVIGPLVLRASEPLGLYHRRRPVAQLDTLALFPCVYPVAGLDRLGARPSFAPQDRTEGRPGQGATYLGVRDYRQGDDPRRIHWPATARRGALVVKEYEVDLIPYFSLFLDLDRTHRAGTGRRSTLEFVVRTAASILWTATRRGDLVQVFADGGKPVALPPGRGELHMTYCLYELIRMRQEGTTGVLDLIERHRLELPRGSTATILAGTVSLDEGRLGDCLDGLEARGVRPVVVLVNEHSFTPVDRWPLPQDRALARCRELAGLLRARGVAGTVLSADDDLENRLARVDLFEAGA